MSSPVVVKIICNPSLLLLLKRMYIEIKFHITNALDSVFFTSLVYLRSLSMILISVAPIFPKQSIAVWKQLHSVTPTPSTKQAALTSFPISATSAKLCSTSLILSSITSKNNSSIV